VGSAPSVGKTILPSESIRTVSSAVKSERPESELMGRLIFPSSGI
jgi:hypothetical protein